MNRFISWGEVRLGLRLIGKQPVLSATIILALATGICFATMGFTFRDAMVNSTLPFPAGDRFVRLNVYDRDGGRIDLDLARYHAFVEKAGSFEHLGALGARPFTISHPDGTVESVPGAFITPRSMKLLPGSPLVGRTLIPADGESGAEAVVLLGETLWERRYGRDANITSRQIVIGGRPRAVVGVMPASFQFPDKGELWLPLDDLTLAGTVDAPTPGLRVFGVVRAGTSFETASLELNELSRDVSRTIEGATRDVRVQARSYTSDGDQAAVAMSALLFVLVMLLLVVASNVATLVFARTWSRAGELAVRSALGAARSRVVGQLFVEVLILGSIAAVIGLTAARAILGYLEQTLLPVPFWISFDPSPRTMAFVVFLTLLVSAVSGLWPALRVTRSDLRNTLQAGRGFAMGGFGRAGAVLMIVEIALSVALLNGAVTMARAFNAYFDEVPALPVNQVLTAQLGRIESKEMRDKIVVAAAGIPGVQAAGAAQHLPRLYPPPRLTSVESIGDEPAQAAQLAPSHAVGNGFLEAIGARPLAGRLFNANDFLEGAAPVAVVNEPFVKKFLGGRNPIGRRIRVERSGRDRQEPWREIVGVVPDLGLSVGDKTLAGGFYTPVRDEMLYFLALRSTADPRTMIAPLRAAVAHLDPDLQLEEILPLEDAGRDERAFLVGIASALTLMGGMALALSIVGIYALLSFMVTRRTREIGIRVALGARNWQVLRSITAGAALNLAIGGLLGSALGIAFVALRSQILISIPPPGVWMPATIFLTLAVAGLTACWLPARRALGIRPAEALNSD